MHFTIEQQDATTIFRLKEPKLDSLNASQLKAEFLILAQASVEVLIVDLSEVGHVDSVGLSALLLAQRQMNAHRGSLVLVGVHQNVLSLLRLTQLERVFTIYPTVESALTDERDVSPSSPKLGPEGPTLAEISAGSISAGGSFGAAALAQIMLGNSDPNDMRMGFADDDFDDDDDEDDDFDDDIDELDEEEFDEEEGDEEDEEDADEEPDDDEFEDDFDEDDFDEDEDDDDVDDDF